MLLWDPVKEQYLADETPSYGTDTLEDFFNRAVKEGLKGQELGDQVGACCGADVERGPARAPWQAGHCGCRGIETAEDSGEQTTKTAWCPGGNQ